MSSNGFEYGAGSLKRLSTVVRPLQDVCKLALTLSTVDISVVYGIRSQNEQAELVKAGFSKTLNSRHLTGHAVDLVPYVGAGVSPYPLNGDPLSVIKQKLSLFEEVARAISLAADELEVLIQWGNDWNMNGIPTGKDPLEKGLIQDMPHFQIPWYHNILAARQRATARRLARSAGVSVIF